ncbi:MAG: 3-hydroxyacyl-CoA dehydrogenase NAD-binding domain-containing protein [Nitrospira sp.]|nr:3-hydroxyacyl-CoA dehydrogenase NAD-binding domain-containing protein [Nitrospira sp.]
MQIKQVGVVGCGLMGSGITQVCAQAGYPVIVREISQELLGKGLKSIDKFLSVGVERKKLTEEQKAQTLARIKGTVHLEDLKNCDLIIEAVVEDINLKKEIFGTLDKLCPPETILASNTSSLTVIEMAAVTHRPDRVAGLHFFNPAPLMKLVEVVRTIATSEQTFNTVFEFAKSLGKEPVAAKDNSGFIVNFLLVPYMLGAIRALENGLASKEDIDKAMKLGCGYPMGPFELLDFVGLDTTYKVANIFFEEYRDRLYAPPPLLKKMVLAGYLGRKSGKGFYDYTK